MRNGGLVLNILGPSEQFLGLTWATCLVRPLLVLKLFPQYTHSVIACAVGTLLSVGSWFTDAVKVCRRSYCACPDSFLTASRPSNSAVCPLSATVVVSTTSSKSANNGVAPTSDTPPPSASVLFSVATPPPHAGPRLSRCRVWCSSRWICVENVSLQLPQLNRPVSFLLMWICCEPLTVEEVGVSVSCGRMFWLAVPEVAGEDVLWDRYTCPTPPSCPPTRPTISEMLIPTVFKSSVSTTSISRAADPESSPPALPALFPFPSMWEMRCSAKLDECVKLRPQSPQT